MVTVIGFGHYGGVVTSLVVKIFSGIIVYALLILVFDRELRGKISLSLFNKDIAHETV